MSGGRVTRIFLHGGYEVGDIVRLNSGGPEMVVMGELLIFGDQSLSCSWKGGHATFPEPCLTLIRRRAEAA